MIFEEIELSIEADRDTLLGKLESDRLVLNQNISHYLFAHVHTGCDICHKNVKMVLYLV